MVTGFPLSPYFQYRLAPARNDAADTGAAPVTGACRPSVMVVAVTPVESPPFGGAAAAEEPPRELNPDVTDEPEGVVPVADVPDAPATVDPPLPSTDETERAPPADWVPEAPVPEAELRLVTSPERTAARCTFPYCPQDAATRASDASAITERLAD